MDVFSMIFQVFPENGKVRFDCAGASGLRFRPLMFWLCAAIFASFVFASFFYAFSTSLADQILGVGGSGGTPLIMFN